MKPDCPKRYSKLQHALLGGALNRGFLEVEVRLVVGMLGTLRLSKQSFNCEQLNAGNFLLVGRGVETGEMRRL